MTSIYLRHGDTYVPMSERGYEREDVLQQLIERHPEMLGGDDSRTGPFVLVKREAGVGDQEDGGARWSLDHLYLDAQGIPTLVAVKRSTDTRARREVVAQMLDYAANARTSFNVGQLQAWLGEDAERRHSSADEVLRETLSIDDLDAFWEQVATNLAAERMRLIFVADVIAPELRRIIEFLNGQMTDTTVLGIEVKQYADASGAHQTIVPRVIGDTEQAQQAKHRRTRTPRIDRDALLTAIAQHDSAPAAQAARALLDWGEQHPAMTVRWGASSGDIGLPRQQPLVRIWNERGIEVRLQTLRHPNGWDDARIRDLVDRLQAIDGLDFSENLKWPKSSLTPLADVEQRRRLVTILHDVVDALTAQT